MNTSIYERKRKQEKLKQKNQEIKIIKGRLLQHINDEENLIKCWLNNKENLFGTKFRYHIELMITTLKEKCNSKIYDNLFVAYFKNKQEELLNPKNKVIVNYIIDGITNPKLKDDLFKQVNKNNKNLFEEITPTIFDIHISKENLYSLMSFKKLYEYNELYKGLKILNNKEYKEKFDILELTLDDKAKSSTSFRYTFRIDENKKFNKENAQDLIVAYLNTYKELSLNSETWEILDKISPEMLHSKYLEVKLGKSEKDNKEKNKTNKI